MFVAEIRKKTDSKKPFVHYRKAMALDEGFIVKDNENPLSDANELWDHEGDGARKQCHQVPESQSGLEIPRKTMSALAVHLSSQPPVAALRCPAQ